MIEFTLPVKTGRGLNDRMHWAAKAKQAKKHRQAACYMSMGHKVWEVVPATITLCRMSWGTLDPDNLQGACKHLRDGIADAYGMQDNDPRLVWKYEQTKVKRGQFGVRVTIEADHESP
jgi:hypothetical protein